MRAGRSVTMASAALLLLLAAAVGQDLRAALALEQSGQLEAALAEYGRVLGATPASLGAYQGLVRVADGLGRFDTLASISRRLAAAAPDQPEFAVGLARGLLGMRRSSEGVAEARRIAVRWPDRVPVLAAALAEHGQPAEALRYWRQARAASGDSSAYAGQIVAACEAAGDIAGAVREIVDELGRQPKAFVDFRQRIAAYAGRGNAARLLAEAGRIPDPATRARARATVYLATKRVPEAVRVIKELGDRTALLQFGRECEDEAVLEAAVAVYRELELRVDAARVLRRLGRSAEARRELGQASGTEAQVELGSLLLESREFERAAAAFESALRQRPGDEAAAFGLGSARLAQGRLADARAAALGRGQQSDRLLLLAARSHFYAGEFDSCQMRVTELVRRYPRSVLANDGLELAVVAGAGERAGELARAMLDFESGDDAAGVARARALTGGDTVLASHALLLIARFDRRQGRPRDALARLDTLIGRYPSGPLAPRATYEKAVIYREELHDDAGYKEALERLVLSAPGSPWAPVARSLLAEANRPVGGTDIR